MKQIIMLLGALLVGTCSYADMQSSGFSKGSAQLKSIGLAWKAHEATTPREHTNDIEMVYGGQDISGRPSLSLKTATA